MGFVTAWPFAVSCMAAITDVTAVIETPSGLPLIEIYFQGTGGSRVATSILMAFFAFCFFGCAVANGKYSDGVESVSNANDIGTTSSRTLWAISRDGALPFSTIWMQISPRFQMPLNAICLSGTVICLYGLIFLGSTTAFSAMVGAAIIFLQTSCIIPQGILLYRGRDTVLPKRYFNLGKWGATTNAIAVLWVVFLDVIYCLPTALPVTKENMNYISVVSVGLIAFVLGLWLTSKRSSFKGPTVDLEQIRRRREDALHGSVLHGIDERSTSSPEIGPQSAGAKNDYFTTEPSQSPNHST